MPLKYYSNAREGIKNIRSAWLVSIWLLVVTGSSDLVILR